MKVLKVYGGKTESYSVYIDGNKTDIADVENSIFGNYKSAYGTDNLLVVVEDESEKAFLDGATLADKIQPTRVAYGLYKMLSKLAGSGFLMHYDYDAETKTIMIEKRYA